GISDAAAPHIASETAPEPVKDAPLASSTAPTSDDPAPASIDEDRGDWRADTATGARAEGDADALFDQIANHAVVDQGVMDGLLALAALPAEAAVADAPAHDPAVTAVLADAVGGNNAVDQLIDAVAGGAVAQQAAEPPAFDLAHFLDQRVMPDAAIIPHQAIEHELQQLATA